MTVRIITQPASYPVSLDEAKLYCRVDATTEDSLLTRMIQSATQQCEKILKRSLITQTLEYTTDRFTGIHAAPYSFDGSLTVPYGWADRIELPFGPVESIVSVTYLDGDGASQTVAIADYYLDQTDPGVLLPAVDFTWPATYSRTNAVAIRYVAGYGYAAELVPEPIRSWILMRVGTLYENRSQYAVGRVLQHFDFVDTLLEPYKIITVA